MLTRRAMIAGTAATAAVALTGCGSKFLTYDGPEVTSALVLKERRTLILMNGQTPLKAMEFGLGFSPVGHKRFRGDGKTPEGLYYVNRRNPNSAYHLSLGISYPNDEDRAYAASHGRSPGGDIFCPGTPREFVGSGDWTAGCVAISNDAVEETYAMVRDGTPVYLYA